ncbi:MAG: Ig-like domain repeat protein [Edaphobacter sp.]
MGTQSTSPFLRTTRVFRRIALLLSLVSPHIASAQTSALTVPLLLPSAIVFDSAGNLYLAETANHVIRKVDTTGHITTIAGTSTQGFSGDNGPAIAATFDSPQGLALDSSNDLYIADTHNHRIRRIDAATGIITTIAGTGTPGYSGDEAPATTAQLNLPTALAFDSGNNLYIADTRNHRIRKITASTGIITSIAGTDTQGFSGDNGPATAAAIDSPTGLALDSSNNLYLADTHNQRIRRLDATTGIITTIAGNGAPGYSGDTAAATTATLALPHGITIDSNGNLYLADTANHRIRRIDAATGIITTIAGNGTQTFAGDIDPALTASLDSPRNTALSPSTLITLADTNNQRIRQLTGTPAPPTTIQTIAGIGTTTPGTLTLIAPSVISYGTGQLTITLASATPATGLITFFDTTNTTTTIGTAPLASNTATLPASTLPAGKHNITATYTGDQTHPAAQTATFPLTITPQQITANLAPIVVFYGQPIPIITATLSGVLPQDASSLTASFITTATTLSPAGTYPITATLTGPAAGNYALPSITATLIIKPASTITTLSDNSVVNATTGSPITLTATVTSATASNPTGSITLLDNGSPVSSQPLSSGAAVFTIPSITQGSHSYTAFFAGSANYASSTSIPQLITITGGGPTPDFTLTPTGTTSQTILSGSSATFTFTTAFQGNLSSPITLAAAGLPNLATASFNPPTVPPGSATSFTLTISTPNTIAKNLTAKPTLAIWALLLSPLSLLAIRTRKLRTATKLLTLIVLTLMLTLINGCGDRINTAGAEALAPKPYTITVTGTATSAAGAILQHTTTVTLLLESPQ